MRRILLITIAVAGAFILENVLAVSFRPWIRPNILLLLIVFINLFRGIRYSLFTAFIAGFVRDSFSIHAFGIHIFSFVLCAYITTFLKWYFYRAGSGRFRVAMVFLVSSINVYVTAFLMMMFFPVSFKEVFLHVYLPEVMVTTAVTPMVFNYLKRCALRYSV